MTLLRTPADAEREAHAAEYMAAAWKCDMRPFGHLAPVDYYCERDGKLVAFVEVKAHHHPMDAHPNVLLDVHKWLALQLAAAGGGVPAYFAVVFDDALMFVDALDVAGCPLLITGRRDRGRNDTHPAFQVPVNRFRRVGLGAAP